MSVRNRSTLRAVAVFSNIALASLLTATKAPADHGDCGQPVSKGHRPATVDALVALKTSVHLEHCGDDEDECECDVDDSGTVTSRDSLAVLRSAVGFASQLNCDPDCGSPGSTVTSTTLDGDDDDGDDDDGDIDDGEDDDGDDADDDDGDEDDGDDDDGDDDGTTTTTTNPL